MNTTARIVFLAAFVLVLIGPVAATHAGRCAVGFEAIIESISDPDGLLDGSAVVINTSYACPALVLLI